MKFSIANKCKSPANWLIITIVGSFGFTWGLVALCVVALYAFGMDYHEAELTTTLLAFLVFLSLFLWSFASTRRGRVVALLLGGAAMMTGCAWAIQRALLS